ncbi:MAG: immune inhibitor A, partial [Bacteroidetes bacterium]|nr:immune inhibitor A [Bacteroidota bacterium]
GSMGGSYKLEEVYEVFAEMRQKYPDYVANPEVIGYTIEERPIMAYSFGSKNPANKKEVLFTALHHAREGSGLTTLVYFLWNLLEGIDKGNPESEYLLKNRTIYIVPVVNPDGVAFNENIAPNGGGLWRKNRKKINDSTYGVDLNRNYGPQQFWEADNNGSATNPEYETYRGNAPFSEPETQAMRDFCIKHRFKLACNFHSYGELIIFPWGAKNEETPDSIWFISFTEEATAKNNYSFGRGVQTVGYEVSGDSDDWMYYTIPDKSKIFAMTPEVGTLKDGFWPYLNRYIPIAQDNLHLNYQLLWSAGANLRPVRVLYDYDTVINEGVITLTIENIGTEDAKASSKLNFVSLNDSVKVISTERFILPLKSNETQTERFTIPYPYGFENGSFVPFVCNIEQDNVLRTDTINLQLYRYSTYNIFSGGSLGPPEWKNDNWNVVDDKSIGRKVITDSPGGNYSDLDNNYLIFNKPVLVTGVNATLEFNARWNIEPKYDFVLIEASSDSGKIWTNLRSSKMRMGIGLKGSRQDSGRFGFDGFYPDYLRQECDLSQYLNKNVIFRFGLLSDAAANFDGIFIDNIKIRFYVDSIEIHDDNNKDNTPIKCYPSPLKIGEPLMIKFNTKIYYSGNASVALYNALGEVVFASNIEQRENGNYKFEIPTAYLSPGIFFIGIEYGSENYFCKFVAIR